MTLINLFKIPAILSALLLLLAPLSSFAFMKETGKSFLNADQRCGITFIEDGTRKGSMEIMVDGEVFKAGQIEWRHRSTDTESYFMEFELSYIEGLGARFYLKSTEFSPEGSLFELSRTGIVSGKQTLCVDLYEVTNQEFYGALEQ